MTGQARVHTGTRLVGHGLRYEGAAFQRYANGVDNLMREQSGPGYAKCECGALSPWLSNRSQRKTWHKDHKDDLRQGGTGVVWERN